MEQEYTVHAAGKVYTEPDSDIDVALSYEGTISEDTFFNYLKEDILYARNIPIDINPIRKEKSGTLPEYMQRAEYYLDEMENKNFANRSGFSSTFL